MDSSTPAHSASLLGPLSKGRSDILNQRSFQSKRRSDGITLEGGAFIEKSRNKKRKLDLATHSRNSNIINDNTSKGPALSRDSYSDLGWTSRTKQDPNISTDNREYWVGSSFGKSSPQPEKLFVHSDDEQDLDKGVPRAGTLENPHAKQDQGNLRRSKRSKNTPSHTPEPAIITVIGNNSESNPIEISDSDSEPEPKPVPDRQRNILETRAQFEKPSQEMNQILNGLQTKNQGKPYTTNDMRSEKSPAETGISNAAKITNSKSEDKSKTIFKPKPKSKPKQSEKPKTKPKRRSPLSADSTAKDDDDLYDSDSKIASFEEVMNNLEHEKPGGRRSWSNNKKITKFPEKPEIVQYFAHLFKTHTHNPNLEQKQKQIKLSKPTEPEKSFMYSKEGEIEIISISSEEDLEVSHEDNNGHAIKTSHTHKKTVTRIKEAPNKTHLPESKKHKSSKVFSSTTKYMDNKGSSKKISQLSSSLKKTESSHKPTVNMKKYFPSVIHEPESPIPRPKTKKFPEDDPRKYNLIQVLSSSYTKGSSNSSNFRPTTSASKTNKTETTQASNQMKATPDSEITDQFYEITENGNNLSKIRH